MTSALCPKCQTPLPEAAIFCSRCGTPTGGAEGGGTSGAADDLQARLGQALGGHYFVRRLLGQGGFAQVFEVWDQQLERRLAVKVLRPDVAWTSGMLARFRHEAKAIARLQHSHILPIHFVGEGEGIVYYAMPFVEGQSLGDLLRVGGALDPERAVAIAKPILDALQHAHEHGIIHRDIKPENVMIEGATGRPLLVDFGIAKRLDAAQGFTQTGYVVGTPQYMSPEQALGQGDLDARTDVYAMGAMLFQMVTGSPPFEGNSSQEIVGKHLSEPPPVATTRNGRIPRWLSDVIVRCLAKLPDERYQSAAMVADLLVQGRASGGVETVSAERVAKRLKEKDEATVALPSAERPAAAAATAPAATGGRRVWPWILLLLIVGGGAAGAYAFTRPTLMLDNALVEAIAVTVNADPEVRLAAGETLRRRLPRGRLTVHWVLVPPVGASGQPLGESLQGTIAEERPRGTLRHAASPSGEAGEYFAPLITNEGTAPLTVTVNAGLAGARSCGCSVAPGTVRGHIGYYRLYQNSTVRVEDPSGREATFVDLGPKVERESGVVGLRLTGRELR